MKQSFGPIHYALMAFTTLLIVLGMWMLSTSLTGGLALNVAPFVLAFAFLVSGPAAFLWPSPKSSEAPASDKSEISTN
jgi:hypothetical protein